MNTKYVARPRAAPKRSRRETSRWHAALAGVALASLLTAVTIADAPSETPPPRHTRFGLTTAFAHGGDEQRAAYEAEMAAIPGTDPASVVVHDGEVHFRLEIQEIQEEVYPGQFVTFWVFAPLSKAGASPARLPSPTLRVRQGERVKITLYNTHYVPHTIHLHGMSQASHMDGMADMGHDVQPGESFTYEFEAKHPGTYFYHCHVHEHVHIPMGLAGMFIVEPRRDNDNFARVIPGAGRIYSMSKATREEFDAEYSLVYMDVDDRLNRIASFATDAADAEWRMHRDYDTTQRTPNIFLLNGRSYPFTLRDTPIHVRSDEKVKLRVLNVGPRAMYLHPHGHHATIRSVDGYDIPAAAQLVRDTVDIGPSQRVDLVLNTHNDGFFSSGPGMWMLQDHSAAASTNKGIGPGGNQTFILYTDAPAMSHSLARYLDPKYYKGLNPVFDGSPFSTQRSTRAARSATPGMDYPQRPKRPPDPPRLDLLDIARHRVVAQSCAEQPRSFRRVVVRAGRKHALGNEVFAFEPRTLRVNRCEAIELTLENSDEIRHEMMIPGLNPMFDLNFMGPGKTIATFVTPDEDVTLEFHCHVPAHDRIGMMGEIVVGKGGKRRAKSLLPVSDSGPTATYRGQGVVVFVIDRAGKVIVNHEEISGLMPAMEMSFGVDDPALLQGLQPGDRITFELDSKRMVLTRINVQR